MHLLPSKGQSLWCSPGRGNPCCPSSVPASCDAVCRGGVQEGTVLVVPLSASFQILPSLLTIKLGPSGADSRGGGFVYILGPCGSLQWTLLWGWEFLPLLPQPPQVFSVRGFEALFPHTGALGCLVYLTPQLLLPVYLHTNVGPPSPQATARLGPPVFSAQLPVSTPPTGLDECFFFNSLVVGLPHSFIFCQFWLFSVFKFVVVLLLVVWGGTMYLPMPPSWPKDLCILFYAFKQTLWEGS